MPFVVSSDARSCTSYGMMILLFLVLVVGGGGAAADDPV
jgi:hypothetical protein